MLQRDLSWKLEIMKILHFHKKLNNRVFQYFSFHVDITKKNENYYQKY